MGLAYLFALIVGAGILTFQAIAGGPHGADHGGDGGGDHGGDHGHDGSKDVRLGDGGFVALFLTTRFWIFAALAFGLSGTLLEYVFGGSEPFTLVTALAVGLASGFGASAAFRALRRAPSPQQASSAVGRMARVLVPIEAGKTGQVRIELDGQLIDLVARTEEGRAERGEMVVIQEVDGELATVSVAPDELKS